MTNKLPALLLTHGNSEHWFHNQDEVESYLNANGLTLDEDFYVEFPDGYRSHQIRLEGGDCSTDSFCYPSV